MRAVVGHIPIILVGLACACSPRYESQAVDAQAVSDAGSEVIRFTADELNAAPRLTLSDEIRIDGDGGEVRLSRLSAIAVTDRRELVVLDEQAPSILVFDSAGRLVRRFGGRGNGPGELQRPIRLVASRDTLYVLDRRGINRFLDDGSYIDRHPISISATHGDASVRSIPGSFAQGSRHFIVAEDSAVVMSMPDTSFSGNMKLRYLDVSTGELGDPFLRVPTARWYPSGSTTSPAHFAMPPRDWQPAVLGDGRIIVPQIDGTSLAVYRDGDRQHTIRFDVPRREVTRAALDSLFERQLARWNSPFGSGQYNPTRQDIARRERDQRSRPHLRYYNVTGRVLAARDGWILVHRPDAGEPLPGPFAGPGPSAWALISPDLEIAGHVQLPSGFQPLAFKDGLIVGSTLDESDVPSITGYRIAQAGRSPFPRVAR